jgi:hypothetical protein
MRLRTLLPILALVLVSAAGVAACEKVASTTVARSVEDGTRNDKSWVRTWADRARFECVASTSGACWVVVFASECPGSACTVKVLRDFRLSAGQASDVLRLPPGFRYCLSHDARPVAPACANL